jgi:hypothetical protein
LIRLVQDPKVGCKDRARFTAVSAQTMRRILVDDARRRSTEKRGIGKPQRGAKRAAGRDCPIGWGARRVFANRPAEGGMIELRFFGGLSGEETAEVLKLSAKTELRTGAWRSPWLSREMQPCQ